MPPSFPYSGSEGCWPACICGPNYPHINPVEAMPMFIYVAFRRSSRACYGVHCWWSYFLCGRVGAGCSILFVRDIYADVLPANASDREILIFSRLVAIALASLAAWLGLSRANLLLVE